MTLAPAEDDEEVFGEAWPLIVEWRGLKDAHPNEGKGPDWLRAEERFLALELALLEDHGMTLPPARFPLRGFDRNGQVNWRQTALFDTRRAIRQRELLNRLSFGLLWRWPGRECEGLVVKFCERLGGGSRKGRRKPSFAGLGTSIMSALLGFSQGFRP